MLILRKNWITKFSFYLNLTKLMESFQGFWFFWDETLFNFARALPGLFFLHKDIKNIKMNRNTTTLGSCFMPMLCIITHYSWVAPSHNLKKKFENHSVIKLKKLSCYRRDII